MKRDLGFHPGEFVFSFSLLDEQTATHLSGAVFGTGWSCSDHKTPKFGFGEAQCILGNSPGYSRRRVT